MTGVQTLLFRSEAKTYTLGPALVGLGRAASEAFTSLAYARPEMQRLHRELGVATSVAALVDDKIVLLERTGPHRELDRMIQAGQRYPYTPPSGLVFAAWLRDKEIDQWLADYPEVSMDASLGHIRAVVDTSRRLGYWVESMSDVSVGALTVLAGLDGHDIPPRAAEAIAKMVSNLADRYYVARDLRPGRTFDVTFVTAPSFDSDGRPDLLLGLLEFRRGIAYEELARHGEAVRDAAARITEQAGGKDPWAGRRVGRSRVGRPLESSGAR